MLCLSFLAGYGYCNSKFRPLFDDLNEKNLNIISSTTNDRDRLSRAIDALEKENDRLAEIIKDYENRPEKVRYVTRIETIIEASDPVIIPAEEGVRPDSYTFELANGMPVARFESAPEDYIYTTYNLELETDVVIGEETTTVMVTAFSSGDPETPYSLPSRVSVKDLEISDHRKLKAEFYLGVTADIDQRLNSNVYGSLGFPFFHPTETLDVATPRVSFNSTQTKVGVDIVSWNAASRIPLLSDIWVSPGVSKRIDDGLYTADFTIGSRF